MAGRIARPRVGGGGGGSGGGGAAPARRGRTFHKDHVGVTLPCPVGICTQKRRGGRITAGLVCGAADGGCVMRKAAEAAQAL